MIPPFAEPDGSTLKGHSFGQSLLLPTFGAGVCFLIYGWHGVSLADDGHGRKGFLAGRPGWYLLRIFRRHSRRSIVGQRDNGTGKWMAQ